MKDRIQIRVLFHSYCRDIVGIETLNMDVAKGTSAGELLALILEKHPKLQPMQRALLIAVGLDYAPKHQVIQDGDEISLFPPVQGG